MVDSVFRNHSHDNAGSGIMLDFESNRNRVDATLVEHNAGDGVVVLGPGDNVVIDNDSRRNRVGVRLNNPGQHRQHVSGNRFEASRIGVQAYGGASDVEIIDNTIRDSIETG